MTNGHWIRALFFLVASLMPLPLLGQATWHEVTLRFRNEPFKWIRTIAIPAEAEYKGRKVKAYVYFSGRDGRQGSVGYPDLGIYVEGVESLVPQSELEQFMGPDLSKAVLKHDAIVVTATRGTEQTSISALLLYASGDYLATGFKNDGAFETNRTKSKRQRDAWLRFLAESSQGFDRGKAVIGGKVLSDRITVEFSGNGLGTQLKELIAFCHK